SPFARKAPVHRSPMPPRPVAPKPHVQETTLKTCTFETERKTFSLFLKENKGGRFVRITEDVGGRRNSIVIPESGLEAFVKAFAETVSDSPAPQV
ncbi:MAG: hypothetical protein ACTHLW_21790, partial [Verrucomicrobiota bacterium]